MLMLKGLKKSIVDGSNTRVLFENVNLTLKHGEIIGLVGPSGSGKSSLLHILGCLDSNYEGEYYFGDKSIHSLSRKDQASLRAKSIGFVFQHFNLIEDLTIIENITLIDAFRSDKANKAKNKTKHTTKHTTKALHYLEILGLKNRAHAKPSILSGGEKQRVALARALYQGPSLLLCDEPTGNLDEKNSHIVLKLLEQFIKEDDKRSVIIVSHQHALIKPYCSSIYKLCDQKLIKNLKKP